MKQETKSYKCECGKKWQEWVSEGELHQTFNDFAFDDFRNPEIMVCSICKNKENEPQRETVTKPLKA